MRKTTLLHCLFLLFFSIYFSVRSYGQFGSGGVVWQKAIGYGNNVNEVAKDVYVNPDGSIIIAGWATSGTVIKLDTAGRTVWQTYLPNTDIINTVIAFDDTSYLCVGSGVSVDTTTGNHWGGTDIVLARLNQNGSVIWKKYYGGSKSDIGIDAVRTTDGGFAVLSNVYSIDGQVAGAAPMSDFEYSNAWVFKINPGGNLLWQKNLDFLDSSFNDDAKKILIANDQQLMVYAYPAAYFVGQISGEVSYFNQSYNGMPGYIYPSAEAVGKTENGDAYIFSYLNFPDFRVCIKKIALDGTLVSIDTITELIMPATTTLHGIAPLPGGGYLSAGQVDEPTWPATPREYLNGYMYNSDTKQLLNFGTLNDDFFNSVKLLPGGDGIIAVGSTNGYYTDEGQGPIGTDIWVVKIGFNAIRGKVFVDANNNNVQDAGEMGLKNVNVTTSGTNVQVTTQPFLLNGDYTLNTGVGTFTTKVQLLRPYYTSVPDSITTTFTANYQVATGNFALHPISGIKDCTVGAVSNTRVRPGFNHSYQITCTNNGTDTQQNRQLVFVKDSRFGFFSAIPAPASVTGNSIVWNISNLYPNASTSIALTLVTAVIPQVNIGDTLRSTVSIDSTGDAMAGDNIIQVSELVSGSNDPNDKQENYAGKIPLVDVVDGKSLDYLIRFQNTGNDTAFTIVVRDTLDAQLDASGFIMLNASHPYQLSIKDGKYITWTFKDIKLADSFHNEAMSHGYISYRIKPKLPVGIDDIISNRAAIYFDFNPAILTNNQQTKVSGPAIPATWTGAVSVAWEDPLNWNTHKVPDINTIVVIPAAVPHYPEISSNTGCYGIKIEQAAILLVKTGVKLKVTGQPD